MDDREPTTAELLDAWREATRAAELAERLVGAARAAAAQSDQHAEATAKIARLAEVAADAATRAAITAREVATESAERAASNHLHGVGEAEQTLVGAHETESTARDRFHRAEENVRDRYVTPTERWD